MNELVAAWQQLLQDFGYYSGPISGAFDAETLDAGRALLNRAAPALVGTITVHLHEEGECYGTD